MNFDTDERIYKGKDESRQNHCEWCGTITHYVTFGFHSAVCSPFCLRKLTEEKIVQYGLVDWVVPIEELRVVVNEAGKNCGEGK